MTGSRPVIDFMFADFVLDGVGEIINQIAKIQYMSDGRLKMPILLRGCVGIGHSAATHHSGNYYPMFAHFPGLRVVLGERRFDAVASPASMVSGDFRNNGITDLAVLEDSSLVTRRRAGREVLFSVRPDGLAATAQWLTGRAGAWQERLK